MKKFLGMVLALLLAGCATINGGPSLSLSVLMDDLAAARDNFAAAGLVAESQCMADAIAKLQTTPLDLKVKGIVSLGSVAYIEAMRVREHLAAGPNALSPACQQIVGKVVLSLTPLK